MAKSDKFSSDLSADKLIKSLSADKFSSDLSAIILYSYSYASRYLLTRVTVPVNRSESESILKLAFKSHRCA